MNLESLVNSVVALTKCESKSVGDEENPEYRLTVHFEKDGRNQEIYFYPFEEDGKELVRMYTYIGDKSEFSPNKLLSFLDLNMSLRHGAFAFYQGQVVIQASHPMNDEEDVKRINEQMQYLMKMADSFEKILIGQDKK